MRILMVSHLYPSRANPAYGTFVHSQVKALVTQGAQIKVIAPTPWAPFPLNKISRKWNRYHNTPLKDRLDGIEVYYPRIVRLPRAMLFQYAGMEYYRAVKNTWSKLNWLPNVIHAQVGYPDGWAAAELARKLGIPLVVTLHGQELQKQIKWGEAVRSKLLAVLDTAEAIVVPSEKLYCLAERAGVRQAKLHLIPNGVEQLPQAPLPKQIQDKITGKQVVLTVARLVKEKNVDLVVEAVANLGKKFPDLTCIIVGDGPEKRMLVKKTRLLGIEDKVIFADAVPHSCMGAYYQAADVFVLPSKDEAFGIVYLEAMAAGVPVVATEGEGLSTVISAGKAGKVVPSKPIDLARAIDQLLDPDVGRRLGANGRVIASKYCWINNARSLLEVYRKITDIAKGGVAQ